MKLQMQTIDITPTWAGITTLILANIESGSAQGRKIAIEELQRMAEAADKWNAHCKEQKR